MEEPKNLLEVLRCACEENPDDLPAVLALGQHYVDLGWFNEALELFRTALDRNPEDSGLLLEYGNTAFKKEDFKEAARVFELVTVVRPEKIEGWNNVGIAQLQLGAMDVAEHAFARVLEIEPRHPGALLNRGNCCFNRGEFEEALDYFAAACEEQRDFADAWYNYGNTLIKLDRLTEAQAAFEKALRYKREFPSALKNLGYVYEHAEEFAQAQRCYLEAITLHAADAQLHVNLGNVYLRQKQFDEAKKSYLKAIRLAPHELHGWMGLRMLALEKGDLTTFVRATLAVLPRLSDEVLAQSIEVLYDLNQISRADELLVQADRLGRTGDLFDLQRLLLFQRQGKNTEKVRAMAQRLAAIPDPPDQINRGLARYALKERDYQAVLTYISKIEHPDTPALSLLWRAQLALGQIDGTRKMIRGYIAEYPESFDAYFLLARIEAERGNRLRAEVFLVQALEHGFTNMEELHMSEPLQDVFEAMTKRNGELLTDAV